MRRVGITTTPLSSLAVAGCAAQQASLSTEYREPGWMAQARQEVEEYQAARLTCLAEHGVEGSRTVGGSVAVAGSPDENGNLPPGVQELNQAALEACQDVEPPASWFEPPEDAYLQMLDVRECLMSAGYQIPEPPSEAVWLEQVTAGQQAWSPYLGFNNPGVDWSISVSFEEVELLMDTCPQSGYGLVFFYR